METLIKFKSFICRYDDFDRADLSYPEDQSKPITVEVYMKDGRNITVFAANNILACWLFLESMEIIKPKEKMINGCEDLKIESLPIFDKDGKIRRHIESLKPKIKEEINEFTDQMEKMCENIKPSLLPHEAFYCCYKKLEYLSDVMIGKKWHCKVCDEKYSSEDLALKKNIKKGSH